MPRPGGGGVVLSRGCPCERSRPNRSAACNHSCRRLFRTAVECYENAQLPTLVDIVSNNGFRPSRAPDWVPIGCNSGQRPGVLVAVEKQAEVSEGQ